MKGNDDNNDLSKFAVNREENNTAPIFKKMQTQSDAASHHADEDMNQANNTSSPSKENKTVQAAAPKVS